MKKTFSSLLAATAIVNLCGAQNLASLSEPTEVFNLSSSLQIEETRTFILDSDNQPPLLGAIVKSPNSIIKKGLIVSSNIDNMDLKADTRYIDPDDYTLWGDELEAEFLSGGSMSIFNYRVYDCTSINEEQFSIRLMWLLGDTDYYYRSYFVSSIGDTIYSPISSFHTVSFDRATDVGVDYSNVWYAFSYDLFDLISDEIIDPDEEGFYYSTQESPLSVSYQIGTGYNSCYKFKTIWNYKLWYSHVFGRRPFEGPSRPKMTYSNGQLTISANIGETIYYSINGNSLRPEEFENIYTGPICLDEPCVVHCCAVDSEGYPSFTNSFNLTNDYLSHSNQEISNWYVVKIRTDKYMKTSLGDNTIYASFEENPTITDDYLWGFIENEDGTYTIVNKAYGLGYAVCSESGTNEGDYVRMREFSDAEHFEMTQAQGGFYFHPSMSSNSVYLNDCWCGGVVRYNYSTDDGSVLRLIESDSYQYITRQPTEMDMSIEVTHPEYASYQWYYYALNSFSSYEDWCSDNMGIDGSTSQHSYLLTCEIGQELSFDWSVDSEDNYDCLIIYLNGETIIKASGQQNGSYSYMFHSSGQFELIVTYSKDGSVSRGSDQASVTHLKINEPAISLSGATNNKLEERYITESGLYFCMVTYSISDVVLVSDKVQLTVESETENSDYSLYIPYVDACVGTTISLPICLKNSNAITLWQGDLYLPEGISFAIDNFGDPLLSLSGDRTTASRHTLAANVQPDGALRILCSSNTNKVFTGNDGEVATIVVQLSNNMSDGDYPIIFKNVKFVEPSTIKHEVSEIISLINVRSYTLGDVNGDGEIDGADLVGIVNFILNASTTGLNQKAADVNSDGVIDGSDYVTVVNTILGISSLSPRKQSGLYNQEETESDGYSIYADNIIVNGQKQAELHIQMDNVAEVTLWQADITLPCGVSVSEDEFGDSLVRITGGRTTESRHSIAINQLEEGTYRILCCSSTNKTFSGNSGEVATLWLNLPETNEEEKSTIVFSNIKIVEPSTDKHEPNDSLSYIIYTDTEAIDAITESSSRQPIYNLAGQKLNHVDEGLFIYDGRVIFK